MKAAPAFLAAILVLTLLPAAIRAATPPNDDFAKRTVLTGQTVSSTPVTINDARREGVEPVNTDYKTVWYAWTAPQNGTATFTDAGTTYYSHLAIFNGNALANLVLVTETQGDTASVSFPVQEGFTYQVSIGATDADSTGTAVLNIINKAPTITTSNIVALPAGSNDNFANAGILDAAPLTAFTYPREATRETLEPDFTYSQTVWWLWTAPADAEVTMTAPTDDTFNHVLCVFNGNSLTDLTVVGQADSLNPTVTFPAKAGASYYVSVGVDDYGGPSPTVITSILNITTAPLSITSPVIIESQAAANDNFANAQDLGGNPLVSGVGFNADATTETLESSDDGEASLWWKWTAPAEGVLYVDARGSNFDQHLVAYSGAGIDALQILSDTVSDYNTPASGTFNVTAGTTYHFAIGSQDGSRGNAVFNLDFAPGLAHVSIVANPKTAHYSRTHEAVFTLSYTGSIPKKVKVNYKLKYIVNDETGTSRATKKLKPSKPTSNLNLAISSFDNVSEARLKVFLLPGLGYVVDEPSKAKVIVYP